MPYKYDVKNITAKFYYNNDKVDAIESAISIINNDLFSHEGQGDYYNIRSDLLEHMEALFALKTESCLFDQALRVLNDLFEMEPDAEATKGMIKNFIQAYSQDHIHDDVIVFALQHNQNDRFFELFSAINQQVQRIAGQPTNHADAALNYEHLNAGDNYHQGFDEFLTTLGILQEAGVPHKDQLASLALAFGAETTFAMAVESSSFTQENLHEFQLINGLLGD